MTKKLIVLIRKDTIALQPYADFACRDLESRGFEVYNQYENSNKRSDQILRQAADYVVGPEALETITTVKAMVDSIGRTTPPAKYPLMFRALEQDALLPSKSDPEDAGYDLYLQDNVMLDPGSYGLVGTGVAVELFPDEWALINGRSSTLREFGVLVAPGVVDSGYQGELKVSVQNLSQHSVSLAKGQRIAQLILMPNVGFGRTPGWSTNSSLNPSRRGTGGFGSSGS